MKRKNIRLESDSRTMYGRETDEAQFVFNQQQASQERNKSNFDDSIDYRYSEDTFLEELKDHIDGTYSKHYSNEIQTIEYIMSRATTLDGLVMAVFKYIDRYGKKHGWNDEDLFKACHYISMMSHFAKQKFKREKSNDDHS